jgi:putative PIN family toxin of toxin-antitoxin system
VLRGVVDVNVLVSAALTPGGVAQKLLAAAEESRWQPVVSPHLLDELRGALAYPDVARRLPPGAGLRLVAIVGTVADLVPDAPEPWPGVTGDPNDDYLVALSQATPGIDALISYDPDLTTLVNPVPPVVTPPRWLAMVEASAAG